MRSLLPTSIADQHYKRVAQLIEEFAPFEDLEILVPMLIDTAPAQALTHLAEHFHILGVEGWDAVTTDAEKRTLLKQAIELHRYKGTPWAVRTAVERVGYRNVVIEEGIANFTAPVATRIDHRRRLRHNGEATRNGIYTRGGGTDGITQINITAPRIAWALFRVLITLQDDEVITAAHKQRVKALIHEFKNVRSWLAVVSAAFFSADDLAFLGDDAERSTALDAWYDTWGSVVRRNGRHRYNGLVRRLNNDIRDTADLYAEATVRRNGQYQRDGSIFHNGSTYRGELDFPMNAEVEINDDMSLGEDDCTVTVVP
jgi:phage tail P2-like protein